MGQGQIANLGSPLGDDFGRVIGGAIIGDDDFAMGPALGKGTFHGRGQ